MRISRRVGRAALATAVVVAVVGGFVATDIGGATAVSEITLQAGSDSGASNSDRVTNDTTPTFDIANNLTDDVIGLLRDSVEVASTTAAADGTVALTDPGTGLTEGEHTYSFTRNASPSADSVVVTIDTTAPTGTPGTPDLQAASDTFAGSGTNADNITKDNTPTFDVATTGAPADGSLQLYRGGVATVGPVAVAVTSPTAVTDAVAPDNTYAYTAKYVDLAGNAGTASAALNVTIDTIAATVTPDLNASSDTGRSNTDNITSTLIPNTAPANYTTSLGFTFAGVETGATLTWTRSINSGTAAAQGAPTATATPGVFAGVSVTSVLATIPPVSGSYKFVTTHTDVAGNVSNGELIVTMDVSPPAVPVVDLDATTDTGRSNTDDVTQSGTLKINVTGEANALVELRRDGTVVVTPPAAASPASTWCVACGTLTGGAVQYSDANAFPFTGLHGYVAQIEDTAGNRNYGNLGVFVDLEAPGAANKLNLVDASDTGADDHDDVTSDNTPTFAVAGAEDDALVELFRCPGAAACSAANRIGPLASRIGNGEITAPVTPDNTSTNTSWRFTVRQTDLAGRASAVTATDINVVIDTAKLPAPSAPNLLDASDTGTSNSDDVTSAISPTFSIATAQGRVQLLRDGVVVATGVGAGLMTDPGPLSNGVYRYTAKTFDTAGNDSGESAPLMVTVQNGSGYWLAASDGGVFAFGGAGWFGSHGGEPLNKPIVTVAATPSQRGYWLVASDGGVFTYGDAGFVGSTGDVALNSPIVGMVPTATGNGYWLFAGDGGVFTFGDAAFYGAAASQAPSSPIVAMKATPDGLGYWMITKSGKVYAFGSAASLTDLASMTLNAPIVGAAVTPSGRGLWLAGSDGGVFGLGDAAYFGSMGGTPINRAIIGMAAMPAGDGYWLLGADGGVFAFGRAAFLGSTGGMTLNRPVVGMAAV